MLLESHRRSGQPQQPVSFVVWLGMGWGWGWASAPAGAVTTTLVRAPGGVAWAVGPVNASVAALASVKMPQTTTAFHPSREGRRAVLAGCWSDRVVFMVIPSTP
jgi:hypothetical protein